MAFWKSSIGILLVFIGRDHIAAFVLRCSQYDWKPSLLNFWHSDCTAVVQQSWIGVNFTGIGV